MDVQVDDSSSRSIEVNNTIKTEVVKFQLNSTSSSHK